MSSKPYIHLATTFEEQDQLLQWLHRQIPWCPIDYYRNPICIGSVTTGPSRIRGVICFHDFVSNPFNGEGHMIEMSGAGTHPRWLTKNLLLFGFGYVFGQLGCKRMNTVTPASNVKARRVDEKLGFVQEGRIREALPDGDDLIIYGMLKSECKWYKGE